MCWNTPAEQGRAPAGRMSAVSGASSTPVLQAWKAALASPTCQPAVRGRLACPTGLPGATSVLSQRDGSFSHSPSAPLRSFTSSLKGRGGTVLSRLNMSSHRSARMHSARLSTSFAIGPTAATTGGDQESVIMAEGRLWLTWSMSCKSRTSRHRFDLA